MSTRDSLPLWIVASVCKHFTDSISGIDVHVEGQTRANLDKSDWCEIRIDGPWIIDVSLGVVQVKSEVNVLVGTVMDDTNLYKESLNLAKVMPAFNSFNVYKYGPGDDDDDTCLGKFILEPVRDLRQRVEIARFGQLSPAVRLLQSTVEGHFQMTLFI